MLAGIQKIGPDASAIGNNIRNQGQNHGLLNTAVADANTLKTGLAQLRGQLSDPAQQADVDQLAAAVGRFRQAVQSTAAGDLLSDQRVPTRGQRAPDQWYRFPGRTRGRTWTTAVSSSPAPRSVSDS